MITKKHQRNEDHGIHLLTTADVVELADSITKAGRPFYIDTDHEVENGLDVWAVNSETGEDYPRSWRVMDDLSVLIFNTDRKGNSELVDEKSFEDVHELGVWLAREFTNLAGKNEAIPPRDEWDKLTLESTGLVDPIKHCINYVVPAGCTVTIYDEQPNQPTDDQMVDIKFKVRVAFDDNAAFVYDGECKQTYTGEGQFGLYAIPALYLTPSKESDFPVDTSKVLSGSAGGSLAFSDLSKQIDSTLAKISPRELFKKSPKLGSICMADDMRRIYPSMRGAALAVLYPDEDTNYDEFDFDTADYSLCSYFDDYYLQYSDTARKIKKEVAAGKVFSSFEDMCTYAENCFMKEYSAEKLKNIVLDVMENPDGEED